MPEVSLDLLTFYVTTKAIKSIEGKTTLEREKAKSRAMAFTFAKLIWAITLFGTLVYVYWNKSLQKEAFFIHILSIRASVTEVKG